MAVTSARVMLPVPLRSRDVNAERRSLRRWGGREEKFVFATGGRTKRGGGVDVAVVVGVVRGAVEVLVWVVVVGMVYLGVESF